MIDMLDNKGQIRIVESLLAVLLISTTFMICSTFPLTSDWNNQNTLVDLGIQVLMKLDNDGTLGRLIEERNWTAISEALSLLLPTGISFNLTVYNENLEALNNVTISNGGLGGNNVVSVNYLCVSWLPNCNFYIIRLQLARVV